MSNQKQAMAPDNALLVVEEFRRKATGLTGAEFDQLGHAINSIGAFIQQVRTAAAAQQEEDTQKESRKAPRPLPKKKAANGEARV